MTSQNHSKLMWHEARNQEKHIQKMLVDYRKRAERRKEYYEQIKLDPTQFLQVHGRSTKIHVDPSLYMAAEAPGTMLPWHGEKECMIDRFDGRAHLEEIPPYVVNEEDDKKMSEEWDERQVNYERYRILVQNDFLEISEEKFLQQIRLEELYGPAGNKSIEEEKKALASKKAAIGFSYDNEGDEGTAVTNAPSNTSKKDEEKDESGDESDSDIDLDMTVDVMQLSNVQQQQLNTAGTNYGMNTADFMSLISRDLQEAEELRQAKQHQDEKAMLSGRKSRKERRALKKKTVDKRQSPPSYAARSSPSYEPFRSAHSSSPSPPPPQEPGKIKFITSFGGDDSEHENGSDRDSMAQSAKQSTETKYRRTDKTADRKRNRWDQTSSSSDRRDRERRNHEGDRRRNRSRDRDWQSRDRDWPSRDRDRRSRDRDTRRRYRNDDRGGSRHQRSRSPSKGGSYSRYRNSRSPHHTKSRSKSKEKFGMRGKTSSSPSVKASASPMIPSRKSPSPPSVAPPPSRRYYGRRGGDSESDDEDSDSEKGASNNQSSVGVNNEISSVGQPSSKVSSLPPSVQRKEKLRKKMQLLLKRQYKADKAQEKERIEKQEQERMDREEELREMAIRMRRRERERRHKERSSSSRSSSRSDSSSPVRKRRSSPCTSDEEDRIREPKRTSRRSKSPSRRPGLLPSPNMPPRLMDSRIDLSQPPPPLPDYNYRGWSGGNGDGRPPLCPTPPGEERSSCRGSRPMHSHPPPLLPEKEMDRVLYGGRERDHRDRRGERREDYRGRHEGNGDRSSSSRKKLVDY